MITGGRLGRGARRQLLSPAMPTSVLANSTYAPPLALSLEFTGGTHCDLLASVLRSSTVEVACGPRGGIIDIIEDSICHYLVRVHSAVLCQHPDFVVARVPMSAVRLEPVGAVPGTESGGSSRIALGLGIDRCSRC